VRPIIPNMEFVFKLVERNSKALSLGKKKSNISQRLCSPVHGKSGRNKKRSGGSSLQKSTTESWKGDKSYSFRRVKPEPWEEWK